MSMITPPAGATTASGACDLKVYGIERLRVADASIMPRVPTGNTQAPCVIIGERAAEVRRADHMRPT